MPKRAMTKDEYDELVKKLGRPPMWPPQGKRRPGHGPDTQAPPAIEREDK